MTYGKDGTTGPVIRTSERADPRDELALRLRKLGATDRIVQSARDTFGRGLVDLSKLTDTQLAAQVEAMLEGSDEAFALVQESEIDAARRDPELYQQAAEAVQGNARSVIRWVGTNAARAVVAHEAELQLALDTGKEPRRMVVNFCQALHGKVIGG